jgi:hypothetical protein
MNPSISESLLLSKHLRNRNPQDPAWVQQLDQRFLAAAYERPTEDPFFTGPDDLPYYAFHLARTQDVELIPFQEAIDAALHWATGAAIYPGAGVLEWIYSPGDLVSIASCGTSAFQWQGDWALLPVLEDYGQGGSISVGRPSPDFMAPLVVRCLESILRRVYRSEPKLADRVPAIAVIRPESRVRREQASELLLNAYGSDFESRERAEGFLNLVRVFLPSHLGRRVISFDAQFLPEDRLTTLVDLIAEGGLEPVPEIEDPTAG